MRTTRGERPPALAALLAALAALALGAPAAGDVLFVSSFQTGTIRRFDLPSSVGTDVVRRLDSPEDGVCGPEGTMYFAESFAGRITRWDWDGSSPVDIVPAAGAVDGPEGLAIDLAGNLYFNTRNIAFGTAGAWRVANGDPANGAVQIVPPFTDFGEGSDLVLAGPHAGALLLVARGERQVVLSEPPGSPVQTFIPAASFPPGAELFGVLADGCGDVLVGVRNDFDPTNQGVFRFDPQGAFVDVLAPGVGAGFLDLDSAGNLYVTESGRNAIWKVDGAGTVTLFATMPTPLGVAVCRDRTVPDCSSPLSCSAGGPYAAECEGATTCVALDGSSSGTSSTFAWTSDCPGADFRGTESSARATLCLSATACPTRCTATLTVSEGARSATCSAEVVVDDTGLPAIQGVPPDAAVACPAPPPASPTASDVCDPAPALVFDETRTDGSCPDEHTLVRTWTATDRCGNSVSESQTLSVSDTAPPTLRGVPADETVECPQVPPPAAPTASDDCDPAPGVAFDERRVDGRCPQEYALVRGWTATDRCGNSARAEQTVTVVDTTPPVLSGVPPDATVECDQVPPPAEPSATDACDGAPAVAFSETRVDGRCPHEYVLVRRWTATDACGNAATAEQRLQVVDTTAPALSGVPPDETVECDQVPPPAQPSATDNCDAAPRVDYAETRVDGPCADRYLLVRRWTATDACGNATTAEQRIAVVDTRPPAIAGVPPDETVECDRVPPPAGPTASDNCDPDPDLAFAEVRTPGSCPGNYEILRTWTATDRCGNAWVETQRITVRDTTPPVVEPGAGDLGCLWPPNHWYVCFRTGEFAPVVRDACSEPLTVALAGCASDQPDDAREDDPASPWNGDGHTTEDCVVLADGSGICVRSERAGTGPGAAAQAGRHYGVAVVATDACGNRSDPTVIGALHVPHDQSPHATGCTDPTKDGCRPNQAIPCR